jgi:rubrerythrin
LRIHNGCRRKVLFTELITAEERHKASLLALYHGTGRSGTLEQLIPGGAAGDVMEGGVSVNEALEWTTGRDVADVLDLSIALESNAYDLYIKMERTVKDDHAKGYSACWPKKKSTILTE